MTLANLRTRGRMEPAINSTDVISVADFDVLLNEGALDMNRKAGILLMSGTFSTAASQQTYVLSGASPKLTNFLDIYWPSGGLIYTQSSGVVKTSPNDFKVVSEAWLDLHLPGWQAASASDTVSHVYLSQDSSGNLVLGQHPKPSTTTPQWKVYFVARGTDMSAAGDYPWVSATNLVHLEPFHKGIAFYAMWQAILLKVGNQELAKRYLEMYLAVVEEAAEHQKRIFDSEIAGTRLEAQVFAGQTFGGR